MIPLVYDESCAAARRELAGARLGYTLDRFHFLQCRRVEWRFFAGLTVEETGEALEVSPATIKRAWALARAWLNRELA